MRTLICPACGCSLVRLGISRENAVAHNHGGEPYWFCCQGCEDLFITDPEKCLQETGELIVCPTCLAEKPPAAAVTIKIGRHEAQFCRCPHCAQLFEKNPEFYLERLDGVIPNEGVLDHEGCCVRPE